MRRTCSIAKTVCDPVNPSQGGSGVKEHPVTIDTPVRAQLADLNLVQTGGGGSEILQKRRIEEMKDWLLRLPPRAFAVQPPIKVYSVRHIDPFTVLQVPFLYLLVENRTYSRTRHRHCRPGQS